MLALVCREVWSASLLDAPTCCPASPTPRIPRRGPRFAHSCSCAFGALLRVRVRGDGGSGLERCVCDRGRAACVAWPSRPVVRDDGAGDRRDRARHDELLVSRAALPARWRRCRGGGPRVRRCLGVPGDRRADRRFRFRRSRSRSRRRRARSSPTFRRSRVGGSCWRLSCWWESRGVPGSGTPAESSSRRSRRSSFSPPASSSPSGSSHRMATARAMSRGARARRSPLASSPSRSPWPWRPVSRRR
jgi:hypothetical protein